MAYKLETITIPLEKVKSETTTLLKPRGMKVALPHGSLPEIISPHLLNLIEKTGGAGGPIGLQFIAQSEKEMGFNKRNLDPLIEDHHEIVPGVIYKYRGQIKDGKVIKHGRILWTITRFCASYCRFCTRGREVGAVVHQSKIGGEIARKSFLSEENIQQVFQFLRDNKEINEVILSGGDPLTTPKPYLSKIIIGLSELQKNGDIDIVRIGTRLPIHNPSIINEWHYSLLANLKNPNLMLHINHPAELTEETLEVINNFRRYALATAYSQTVFLKGVNDSVETLHQLFTTLAKEGIRPYYLFQNDPVYWAKHFTIPIKKAIKIWGKLRPRLSGIAATAKFVIDVPFGYGKIPIPEGEAWDVDFSQFYDFKKRKHQLK